MAHSINKVILIGHLDSDPEIRATIKGTFLATASLATSSQWKDKVTGEQKQQTEWHKVVFYNRLAERVGEYLRKGDKIYLEGSLPTRKWQGQDGHEHVITEVVASSMQMLSNKLPQKNRHDADLKKGIAGDFHAGSSDATEIRSF